MAKDHSKNYYSRQRAEPRPRINTKWPYDPYYSGGASSSYSSQYQAVLDYATLKGYTLPDTSQQLIENALSEELKALGFYTNNDGFFVFSSGGDSDFACINWKNPADSTNALKVNSPTYTTKVGFTGGGTSYLNSRMVPSSLTHYTLDDASVMGYSWYDRSPATKALFGSLSSGSVYRCHLINKEAISTGRIGGSINTATGFPAAADTNAEGFYHVQRKTPDSNVFENGVQLINHTIATNGLPAELMYILCRNLNGSPNAYSDDTIGFFSIGASFTGQEAAIFTAWSNYKAQL